jgi:EmrB/QacA subfamily drug resistance transporter
MNPADNPHHERRWLILAILGIAQLMVVLDATVVNVALPSAQKALAFSDDQRQWIITAYSLAFGSMLLLGGKISDLFGRKWTFVGGLTGFALASALGGAATSFGMLAGARALQGLFGALLAPAVLSLLTTTFVDARERGRAFGIYGAIAGSGASVGMLLGGVLTEAFGWRAVMYVNLVLAVAAGAGGIALLHNQAAAHKPMIDVWGTLAVSAGLFALVFGLSRAETDGWGNPLTIGMLAAAGVLLALFVWLQARVDHPLLPLRVLADRNRGASQLSIVLASVSMFGAILFLTYYLQQNLGYSPIETGVAFLPMTVVVMLSATLASTKLAPRVGPRALVTVGMALGAGAMLYLTGLGANSSYATAILPSLVAIGVGLGLVFAPAMNAATVGVRPEDAGVASAAVNTGQQVGGAVGTALLSTLAASATSSFLAGTAATPAAQAAAAVHGYTTAFAWSAGIFAVGALVAALLFARGVPQVAPAAEPAPAMH